MKIENIKPEGYIMKGVYTPANKIDLGDSYLIFVSGVQAPAGEVNEVVTEDIAEQTKLVFEEINDILKQAGATLDNDFRDASKNHSQNCDFLTRPPNHWNKREKNLKQ